MLKMFSASLLVLSVVQAAPVIAAPGEKPPAAAVPGPKVHVSDAEDTTGCDKLYSPAAATAGRTIGAIAGVKLGANMSNAFMAGAVAEEVAIKANNAGRCKSKAEIGQAAQQPVQEAKKKIKLKIPGLGF